ncbi:MAG: glycosyltransferase family 2 protein [Nanoarchaeota archaeon]
MKSVTIVLPTYNNESTLNECLKSIANQDYPKKLFQVIIADGGSTDSTIKIIKKYPQFKLIKNPGRIEEKAKPLAITKYAKGEIIGFIDADNFLPSDKGWLKKMVTPFNDKKISFSDTLYFEVRKGDDIITRYNALIGGDDPIASYLGANDRMCYFNGKIVGNKKSIADKGDYYEVVYKKGFVPAGGSNGFFFRKELFYKVKNNPLNHTVFLRDLVNLGYDHIAKVKQGIVHKQDGSLKTFFRKKLRRVKRRSNMEIGRYSTYGVSKSKMLLLGLYIITIILPIKDSTAGFFRKPDLAWILHPFISLALLFVYGFYFLRGIELESE